MSLLTFRNSSLQHICVCFFFSAPTNGLLVRCHTSIICWIVMLFLTVCKGVLCKNLTLNHHISQIQVFVMGRVHMWTKAGMPLNGSPSHCRTLCELVGSRVPLVAWQRFCPHWGLYRERSSSRPRPPTNYALQVIGNWFLKP